MRVIQTNIKRTYLPPEIIVEEYFDDEMLLAASPLNVGGKDTEEPGEGSDGDPVPEAKTNVWGADFTPFDDEE